jgi:hypothetical protein
VNDRYIVDSNVFIQGKNFHYHFAFCEGFWDWVQEGYENGLIFSTAKVRAELLAGKADDEAKKWAESMPAGFFLDDAGDEYKTPTNWTPATRRTGQRRQMNWTPPPNELDSSARLDAATRRDSPSV